VTYP